MADPLVVLDPLVFGCPQPTQYGYSKRRSTYRMPALKGRPRYRLKDTRAVYELNLLYSFSRSQFYSWRDFWESISHGEDSFLAYLMMDDPALFNTNAEVYEVRAIEPYSANLIVYDRFEVTLKVEVPGGFRTNTFTCPEIYGGPIDALAVDDIYGGPIDNLAIDVIIPCPGVDPNG